MTTVVWMGHLSNKQPMGRVGQYGTVFGGTWPALLWHDFMSAALADQPPLDFPPPDQSLWPSGHYISDSGRNRYSNGGGSRNRNGDNGGSQGATTTGAPPTSLTEPSTSTSNPQTTSTTKSTSSSTSPPVSTGGAPGPGP
ncbi:MAG: hypothetical protein JOZ99_06810 [Actinobacteria bacterium]|nr:hypothetical protein [Actinomycetota bacterium]